MVDPFLPDDLDHGDTHPFEVDAHDHHVDDHHLDHPHPDHHQDDHHPDDHHPDDHHPHEALVDDHGHSAEVEFRDQDHGHEFGHFDPHADAGDVVGTPAEDMTHWHQQHYRDSCDVASEGFILDGLGERAHLEQDLVRESMNHGWYRPGYGTPQSHAGDLLEEHGVPVHRDYGCTFEDLTARLNQGEKVLVCVQSEQLQTNARDDQPLDDYLGIPSQFANHAVQVIGVKDAGGPDPLVILNDPGRPDGCGLMIPLAAFEQAWAPSGHFLVSTALHDGQPAGHEAPLLGGYYNADGTYHYSSDNTDRDSQTGAIIRRW